MIADTDMSSKYVDYKHYTMADISKIETPETFAREQWIHDLAAAHWSDADARAGRIYQKFLPYIK